MELDEWDMQRCHRLGKKSLFSDKTNVGSYSKKTPRPIIAIFLSFKKKKQISVFEIKAEDKRKVSKHLFNRRPNPIAI